jgi:alpha-1,6-mannosyltransferase
MATLITPLDLTERVFAYKVLMNGVHLINLALVWWLLGRTLPSQRRAQLTAFTVFAWNPLVLFDVPGNAHNDALMVTLLLLGVVPLVIGRRTTDRAWLVGVLFVGLSALVKYTTALVGLLYAVPWARQLPSWRARVGWLGGTALLVGAIGYLLFLPWLKLPDVLDSLMNAGSLRLYSNSVPDIIGLAISNFVLDPGGAPTAYAYEGLPETYHTADVRFWMKAITRGLFVLYLVWEMILLWRVANAPRLQVAGAVIAASARAFLVLNLLVLTWVLEWYFLWPLALATLLGWQRMLTRVTVAYTLTSLPTFYVHHYWSTNMPATVVLAYALPPLLLPIIGWGREQLRARREMAILSPAPATLRSEAGLGLE